MCISEKAKVVSEGHLFSYLLAGMLSVLLIQLLLWSLWSTETFAIFSLIASPPFTMESLNATETEEPKQAFTVPLDLDLETTETDPVTDGGIQTSSQIAITSTVTPALDNVTDGVENKIKQRELTTRSNEHRQPISWNAFNMNITENSLHAVDSAPKDIGNNSTLLLIQDTNNEQPDPFLVIPMENTTEEKQCICNIPGPTGQKGDKGDSGEPGELGPQGLEGIIGDNGPKGDTGSKGDKGEMGSPGVKGEPGETCALCEIGNIVDQGIPGNDGAIRLQGDKGEPGEKGRKGQMGPKGSPGEKGNIGTNGIPGIPGETGLQGLMGQRGLTGSKGDRGMPGPIGPQGYRGPAGVPGKKGEKGQRGSQNELDNIAFSVAFRGNRNSISPGQPIRFDKVFVNDNKPYSVNSGMFVASVEGVYFFSYHLSPLHPPLVAGLVHNGRIVLQTQARQSERNACQVSGSVLLHLREDDEVWLQVLSIGQNEFIFDETDSLFSGFILYSLED
ncbi:otolin-1-like isoform X1 [Rana temporaria]|uniref:otolin-1-like isoform X1 n=1 Tax=Rana temporaria TaxID=8407 RepID=UPI001AADFF37|nr:otolin-1-like isoform X1 [Rana temporaria]